MLAGRGPAISPVSVAGQHDQHGVYTAAANGEAGGAPPSDVFASGPVTSGKADASGLSPAQWLARYQRPNIDATMRAWNALSDPRSTLAALKATSAPDLLAWVQDHPLNAGETARLTGEVGSVATSSRWLSSGKSELLNRATVLDGASSNVSERRDNLQLAAATYSPTDLRSDELRGGHTIDRHVGKAQSDLVATKGSPQRHGDTETFVPLW
jgi:hypothetical protein